MVAMLQGMGAWFVGLGPWGWLIGCVVLGVLFLFSGPGVTEDEAALKRSEHADQRVASEADREDELEELRESGRELNRAVDQDDDERDEVDQYENDRRSRRYSA